MLEPMRATVTGLPSSRAVQLKEQRAAGLEGGTLRIIWGVKGSGKSTLLSELAGNYEAAGLKVFHSINEFESERPASPCALLLDDAHRLGTSAVTALSGFLENDRVEVTIACRPGHRHEALEALLSTFQGRSEPIVVAPLSTKDIQNLWSARFGAPAPSGAGKRLRKLTCGLRWLLEHVFSATEDADWQNLLPGTIPPSVLQAIALELSVVETKLQALVIALAVGFDFDEYVPTALAGEDLDGLIATAMSEGFINESGIVPPLLRQAIFSGVRPSLVRSMQRELIDVSSHRGLLPLEVAQSLAADGVQDHRVAGALESAGDERLTADPAMALTLFEAAEVAGSGAQTTAARRAEAAYYLGDLDQAARLIDGLLAQTEVPDLSRAVQVASAVWAARGMMRKSADVYTWLGTKRAEPVAPSASVVLTGTGNLEMARSILGSSDSPAAPTLLAEALSLMAAGLEESLTGQPHQAFTLLIRASDMMTSSGCMAPMAETPAVLAALVGMHTGELEAAGSVVRSALAGGQGGPAHQPRLLLLSAFIAMQQDDPEQARTEIQKAQPPGTTLTPRDELLRCALDVGLARRAGDAAALVQSWQHAREALLHVDVDLYSLLAWGELMVAAARLRESAKIETRMAEVWALLDKLGNPPLWSVPLHWFAVEAALLAERPAALGPHAAALVRASGHSHIASVLAEAGRTWVSVLAGRFSVISVEKAARNLSSIGMRWEGSRLAGHAAPRAGDRKDMSRLMALARDLDSPARNQDIGQTVEFSTTLQASPTRPQDKRVLLSVRELEVAKMVVSGKTYREIGEHLFISPRTAEHHMSRIRRRLGTANRSDTLARLRALLDTFEAPTNPGQSS